MAYRQGPYQQFVELPVPARPKLVSSRSIDPQCSDFEIDSTTGGMVPMGSTLQRVLLLVSFARKTGRFVTDRDMETNRRAVEKALEVLTREPGAAIKLHSVIVESDTAGSVRGIVRFTDLTTGLDQTVQV